MASGSCEVHSIWWQSCWWSGHEVLPVWQSGQVHDSQIGNQEFVFQHVVKVTGTCSGIKLVGHKLACIAKMLPDLYNNQSLQTAFGYSFGIAPTLLQYIVEWQKGGCLMEYKYKLLCQFSTTVGGTRCYLWLKQSHSNSLQGHTKHFYSYVGIEQNGSGWKAPGYSKNGYLVTLKKNNGELENFLSKHPKNLGHRLRMMIYSR